jgi:hypothetical protein
MKFSDFMELMKVRHRVHKRPPLDSIPRQKNPVEFFISCFSKTLCWCGGWDYVSVILRPLTSPLSIVHPQIIQELIWSSGGMILTGESRRIRKNTCPSATSSTTNPTRTDPGANPGLGNDRPATNRLSYGTVFPQNIVQYKTQIYCYFSKRFRPNQIFRCNFITPRTVRIRIKVRFQRRSNPNSSST